MTHSLIALGLRVDDAGVLHAPDGAIVTLAPIDHPVGSFYVLQIALGGSAAVTAVLAAAAIKVVRP
jgi:hypothetical protein